MKKVRADYILKGVLPLLAASTLWGVSYFIRKLLLKELGVFTILFFYSVAAGAFLYLMGPAHYKGLWKRFRKNWKPLTFMSAMSTGVGGLLMNLGLQYIDLGVACLMERMQAIFTIILAALLLGESLTKRSIALGIVGILAGFFLMPIHFDSGSLEISWRMVGGAVCVIGAAFAWSISSVLGRQLAIMKLKPFDMSMIRAVIGIIIMLPLMLIFDPSIDFVGSWKSVLLGFLGGLLGGGIGYSAYYYALRTVSAGVSGILETVTPVTAVILGIVFLNEHLSLGQWTGALVLLAALIGLIYIESRRGGEVGTETQL